MFVAVTTNTEISSLQVLDHLKFQFSNDCWFVQMLQQNYTMLFNFGFVQTLLARMC